jgi:hypothetical protein
MKRKKDENGDNYMIRIRQEIMKSAEHAAWMGE